jgi:hypothetical protein
MRREERRKKRYEEDKLESDNGQLLLCGDVAVVVLRAASDPVALTQLVDKVSAHESIAAEHRRCDSRIGGSAARPKADAVGRGGGHVGGPSA